MLNEGPQWPNAGYGEQYCNNHCLLYNASAVRDRFSVTGAANTFGTHCDVTRLNETVTHTANNTYYSTELGALDGPSIDCNRALINFSEWQALGQEQHSVARPLPTPTQVVTMAREVLASAQSARPNYVWTAPSVLKTDDATDDCPVDHRMLWNGLCQPTKNWPPNRPLTRKVVVPKYLTTKPRVINISIGRQLFVDTFMVQSAHNVKTTFHAPEYADDDDSSMMTSNPVLKSTEPWEIGETAGGLAGTAKAVGVWWLAEQNRYEMFYRCGSNALCLAYSADAVQWTKPLIDNGFKSCGGRACNMVMEVGGIGNSAVWLDQETQNSSRRYILAASHTKIDFYSSTNGTKFSYELSSGPVEDCSTIYKDLLRQKWVYSIKASGPQASPGRTRRYWEGDDVLADSQWGSISGVAPVKPGSPVQWMGSDALDDPNLACGYTPSL